MSCAAGPAGPEQSQLDPVAAAYLQAVSAHRFEDAAALFHYPENEEGETLRQDHAYVVNAIRALESCFGASSNARPGYNGIFLEMAIGGGTLAHWREHSSIRTVQATVDFQKLGPGRIAFDLIQIGSGSWEVRQVKYGLPMQDPRTKPRLTACMARISSLP